MAAVESIAATTALGIVSEIVASVVAQCYSDAQNATSKASVKRLIGAIQEADSPIRRLPLSIVPHLPAGKSIRDLDAAMRSLPCQAALKDVIAVELCDDVSYRPVAVDNLMAALAAEWLDTPNERIEPISSHIADSVRTGVGKTVGALSTRDPAAAAQLRQEAQQSRIRSSVASAHRHRASWTNFASAERLGELHRWRTAFRRQIVARHGHIVPPDYDQKRRVPIRELYVPPRISAQSDEIDTVIDVAEFAQRLDRTVLLGDPGGGKSTAADYIASELAREVGARTPFVVLLREYAQTTPIISSVVQHITDQCAALYQCEPPDGAVEHTLLSGQALVIFDGLDELLDPSRRRDVAERVELFAEAYPHARILVTSRRVGYAQARLDPGIFDVWELAGFNSSDVNNYVARWFSYVEELPTEAARKKAAEFAAESEAIADLAATPLMLSLMCIIYRGQGYLPRNRPEVYRRCATLLFETWDRSRQIRVELRTSSQMDNAIKHLALWIFTNEDRAEAVLESEIKAEVARFLQTTFDDDAERESAAQEFVDFCRGRAWVLSETGLDPSGQPLFKFTHRTFLEYFAAYELTRRSDGPEALARELGPRIMVQEWDVVSQLAVQIIDSHSVRGAQRFFDELLGMLPATDAKAVNYGCAFIWRCLTFTPTNAALIRTLLATSMESAFVLSENDTGGEFRESLALFEAMGVMQESSHILLRELESVVADWVASVDADRRAFARFAVASWGVPAARGARKDIDREHVGWASDQLRHLAQSLSPDDRHYRDLWTMALMRRSVTIDEFLLALEADGADLLELLFTPQAHRPFGWGYVDWAQGSLRLLEKTAAGEVDENQQRVWLQMSTVGRVVSVPKTFPGVLGTAGDWLRGAIGEAWQANDADEEAWWAAWVLLACHVELRIAREGGAPAGRQRDAKSFTDALVDARKGRRFDLSLFQGTGFMFTDGERRQLRDDWFKNAIDYVVLAPGGGVSP
ncbi:NACHT domain-containing NTPase [Cellulomonas sp. PSBB021]|uniref:NACHT domain-containing protein n=1 Tax=Cellulomonas sp. PSBB021 TaxID=2003551 RepID=UPI0012FD9FDD|nr:NACHT domain-containing protein [Cellulomonas sp. PSBB021]